jgi:putative methionine-R-sulfoxide reductase with GAF domain
LRSRIPASTFVFYGYVQERDAIVAIYATGDGATDFRRLEIPLGERLSGWVAATRETIVNSDARLDLEEAARDGSALRSALAVPVEADGRVVAVLSFYAAEVNAFADTHCRLAQAAAHVAACSRFSCIPAHT